MNTEDLKKLGLNDEQVKDVMALKGEAIKAEQAKQQATIDEITAERDSLNEQIAQRDTDIKALKKASGANEELSSKLSELQTKYDADTKALSETLATTKLNSAISEALGKTSARDPQDLKAFLNMDDIKLEEDGSIAGLNDQIKTLQESKAYLFNEGTQATYNPAGGSASSQSTNLAEAMKSKDFNFTEFLQSQQGE
ncbi:phage scaffolding protein [Weissella soli]|uniref:phage scaffolding protein n=1 Tax=Weissella soli TaxID=155866 RepID=UPI003EF22819